MEAHEWDERYRGATLLWTERSNQFLVEEISGLRPGRALDLGTGEGRNAVWLAEQGWRVTAVDFSRVALDRGAAIAQRSGVDVEWVHADLTQYRPAAAAFDLVVILYLHLPPDARRGVLGQAMSALRPGGRLLIVGHDLACLAGYGAGSSPGDARPAIVGQVRVAPAGQPFTGVWWELAGGLPTWTAEGRLLLLAEYDPALRYLCLSAIDAGASPPRSRPHVAARQPQLGQSQLGQSQLGL